MPVSPRDEGRIMTPANKCGGKVVFAVASDDVTHKRKKKKIDGLVPHTW